MENAAKALTIAGGVLIAIAILAGLVYVFNRMKMIPEQQDYIKQVEEVSEFNSQFEAYRKKVMYGADVLSCLNKVIDNNRRSKEYANGAYDVTLKVKIKSALQDKVEIYKLNTIKGKDVEVRAPNDYELSYSYSEKFPKFNFNILGRFSKIQPGYKIKVGTFTSDFPTDTQTIEGIPDDNNLLLKLSKASIELKQEAFNPSKKEEDLQEWTKVIWYTSAYDFKSRKFKCEAINYNDKGRVYEISFVEM